jgi:hypothetical protein
MSAEAFAAGNTMELAAGGRRQVRGLGLEKKNNDDQAKAASRKIDLGA